MMLDAMHAFPETSAVIPAPIFIPGAGRWPEDVALWVVELDLDADPAGLCHVLAADEIARMGRYARRADKVRFAVARAALRALLGERLGCAPSQLAFTQGVYGRPSLAARPDVSFNLSHSGERALLAVSMRRTVGVDIEVADTGLAWRALLDLVCDPEEARTILSTPDFYRCWTAKEALLKATGEGIGKGLKSIDLAHARLPPALSVVGLDDLSGLAGYSGALAFGPSMRVDDTLHCTSMRAPSTNALSRPARNASRMPTVFAVSASSSADPPETTSSAQASQEA